MTGELSQQGAALITAAEQVDDTRPARRAAAWWGLLGLAALGVLVLLTRWNRLTDDRSGEGSRGG